MFGTCSMVFPRKVTFVRPMQLENAYIPMLSTLFPIIMLVKFVQLSNA